MSKAKLQTIALDLEQADLFAYIEGYTSAADDFSDGAFFAIHEEAVESFNKEKKTHHDWYAIQGDYFEWRSTQD